MTVAEIHDLNIALANQINQEAFANSQSPYAGKFVGLANGNVVAVSVTLKEVLRLLRQAEPDPTRTFFVEASRDYSVVEHIWEMR